ncbi:helix-turn-helix domain-containing protein [Paenibacillus hodogayensis]|uniref:Helix-turn-helix domain-containing protein n=1 Tax=Paenibacillus hodogayensis TaxID=279208 RepID=A0ABV5VZR7_9BACL
MHQIGEICCESGYEIPLHRQYCLELSYIVSGRGYFDCEGVPLLVQEGDLICNAIGSTHAIRTEKNSMLRFLYMGFKINNTADEDMASIQDFLQSTPYYHAKDTYGIMIPFLRNIDEFYSHKPYSRTMIRNYLEEVIVLSYRSFTETSGAVQHYAPQKSEHSVGHTVYAVIRYVEKNILELKSIQTLAKDLGYSYTYLSHVFKQKTGMTLQRYINTKKVEKAMEMMKYGNLSIGHIAERLQYETIQSFSKAFSRIMGCSPSHYIAANRKEATPEPSAVRVSGTAAQSDLQSKPLRSL